MTEDPKLIKEMKPQELMDWIQPQLSGWTLAMISKGAYGYRFQLQSEPPESERTGDIRCITASTLEAAVSEAVKLTSTL